MCFIHFVIAKKKKVIKIDKNRSVLNNICCYDTFIFSSAFVYYFNRNHFFLISPIPPRVDHGGSGKCPARLSSFGKGVFHKSWILQWKVIFHGYFAVRLDSPPTGDEPALLLEGFLHVSNIPTNKVCCLTDFATAPSGAFWALEV